MHDHVRHIRMQSADACSCLGARIPTPGSEEVAMPPYARRVSAVRM